MAIRTRNYAIAPDKWSSSSLAAGPEPRRATCAVSPRFSASTAVSIGTSHFSATATNQPCEFAGSWRQIIRPTFWGRTLDWPLLRPSLLSSVGRIPLIFVADVLDQIAFGNKMHIHNCGPRFGVRLRVINRHPHSHVSIIDPRESLGKV
jgi:hypothetical protein